MALLNFKNEKGFIIWSIVAGVGFTIVGSIIDGKFRWDFLAMVAVAWVLNVSLSWLAKVRKWK